MKKAIFCLGLGVSMVAFGEMTPSMAQTQDMSTPPNSRENSISESSMQDRSYSRSSRSSESALSSFSAKETEEAKLDMCTQVNLESLVNNCIRKEMQNEKGVKGVDVSEFATERRTEMRCKNYYAAGKEGRLELDKNVARCMKKANRM
ncbi:MAG: hypothetical protein NTX76_01745 [Alphaproteobacteria bacterium]|nr:hypothetical protein [Alphaproteobacteria bacterium]